jgi:hypothetical protein
MHIDVKGNSRLMGEDESCTDRSLKRIWILLLFVFYSLHFSVSYAGENNPLSKIQNDEVMAAIVNPFNSTCYDYSGKIIPCEFKKPFAELLSDDPIPSPRFVNNQNGTVTDQLTELVWLKNSNCFEKMDWGSAVQAVKTLKDGDCGPDPSLVLSDGSSSGDWRLPTMKELCTLIDYGKRNPALPDGHKFWVVPGGYHWSATKLDYYAGMAWIVYIESGTTCYEDVHNRAGHIWPVRNLQK